MLGTKRSEIPGMDPRHQSNIQLLLMQGEERAAQRRQSHQDKEKKTERDVGKLQESPVQRWFDRHNKSIKAMTL